MHLCTAVPLSLSYCSYHNAMELCSAAASSCDTASQQQKETTLSVEKQGGE